MTFQPVNSLLSWIIATDESNFHSPCTVCYWRLCGLTNSPQPSQLRLMYKERRRFSQTMASGWQTAFVVYHKMSWCALLSAVKNYNKSLEKLQDFFFKTETKTRCSRPRLHDLRSRPRLSFLSSRCLEIKTLVSRTTSLAKSDAAMILPCNKTNSGSLVFTARRYA